MFVMPACFVVGDTIRFPFDTYNSDGASITVTGLAITDIEIYKDGTPTARSSDNGYVLLDTDGIDFAGNVGFHGFSVDTSDNSDAGFWVDGSQYFVHVNAVTVDSQTVRFTYYLVLGLMIQPTTAGRTLDIQSTGEVDSNVTLYSGTAGTFSAGRPETNASHVGGTAQTAGDIIGEIGTAGANLLDLGGMSIGMKAEIEVEANDALVANNLDHFMKVAVLATDVVDNSALARLSSSTSVYSDFDAITESQQALRDRGDDFWRTGRLANGIAQGGTSSTIQLATIETFADDELNGNVVNIRDGTGKGQSRVIYDYTGSTDTADVTPDWTTTPDSSSVYEVLNGSINITVVSNVAEDVATATVLATRMAEASINTTAGAVDVVTTLTGHTAQTGDSFARLGAPVGASISADLVVIDVNVDQIETAVITNATGTDIAADIIALKAETVLILADTAGIKVATDKFVFTVANQVDANLQSVNDVLLTGTGVIGDEWGP